jgi:hypothetical protein
MNFLVNLHGWWLAHDPTIRAAIITAFSAVGVGALALWGVRSTIKSNQKEQREQRLLTLRRDAYLKGSEAYAAAAQLLGLMTDPSLNMAASIPIVGNFAAAVAKIHLVGDERLIAATVRLHKEYTAIYLRLAGDRFQMDLRNAEITQNNAQIIQWSNYQLQSEDARQRVANEITRLQQRNEHLRTEVARQQRDMWMFALREAEKLAPLAAEASLAAKEEFGVAIDKERYLSLVAETSEFFIKQGEEALKRLETPTADLSGARVGTGTDNKPRNQSA